MRQGLSVKALDCETVETAVQSMEQILEIGRCTLIDLFQDLDIEGYRRKTGRSDLPPDGVVDEAVRRRIGSTARVEGVCWFHVTRVRSEEDFDRGLLPLGQQIDSIWSFLHDLVRDRVSEEEWAEFRHRLDRGSMKGHFAGLYREKVARQSHWGPYAMLVRDIAFRPRDAGNHDYFRTPEIIEDICKSFPTKYGIDLFAEFRAATRPCIVKFFEDRNADHVLRPALYYLYCAYRGFKLSDYCNTCFDGKGLAVPRDRLLKVEFPDYVENAANTSDHPE